MNFSALHKVSIWTFLLSPEKQKWRQAHCMAYLINIHYSLWLFRSHPNGVLVWLIRFTRPLVYSCVWFSLRYILCRSYALSKRWLGASFVFWPTQEPPFLVAYHSCDTDGIILEQKIQLFYDLFFFSFSSTYMPIWCCVLVASYWLILHDTKIINFSYILIPFSYIRKLYVLYNYFWYALAGMNARIMVVFFRLSFCRKRHELLQLESDWWFEWHS